MIYEVKFTPSPTVSCLSLRSNLKQTLFRVRRDNQVTVGWRITVCALRLGDQPHAYFSILTNTGQKCIILNLFLLTFKWTHFSSNMWQAKSIWLHWCSVSNLLHCRSSPIFEPWALVMALVYGTGVLDSHLSQVITFRCLSNKFSTFLICSYGKQWSKPLAHYSLFTFRMWILRRMKQSVKLSRV